MDKQIYSHHHCRHWAPIATIIVGIAVIVVITTRVLSRFGSTTATSWHQREQQHVCYCDETPVRAAAVMAGPQPTGGPVFLEPSPFGTGTFRSLHIWGHASKAWLPVLASTWPPQAHVVHLHDAESANRMAGQFAVLTSPRCQSGTAAAAPGATTAAPGTQTEGTLPDSQWQQQSDDGIDGQPLSQTLLVADPLLSPVSSDGGGERAVRPRLGH